MAEAEKSGESVHFNDRTLRSIRTLGEITGVALSESLSRVLTDALRTYRWILRQQAQKRTILSIDSDLLDSIITEKSLWGRAEALVDFIQPDKLPRAVELLGIKGDSSTKRVASPDVTETGPDEATLHL